MKLSLLCLISILFTSTLSVGLLREELPLVVLRQVVSVPAVDENPDVDVMIPEEAWQPEELEEVTIERIVAAKLSEPVPQPEEIAAFLVVPQEIADNLEISEVPRVELVGSSGDSA